MGHPKKRIGVKLDMTPMVDVAFLLLIFFMSTTQFKPPEEVSVNLPQCTSEFQVPMYGIIVITVTRDGNVYIGDETGRVAAVPKDQIQDAILSARGKRPGARVIIKGDKDANYGTVADVIDAMQRTQTLRFNLMTELERTEKPGPKPKEN
jgi:biopolymer transport protein ExbD